MIAMQQSVHNLCKGPPFPLLLMGYWACTVHAAWTDKKVKVSGQGTSIDFSAATPEHRISFSTYSLCNSFPCISLQPSSNNYNTIGTFTLSPHSSDPAIYHLFTILFISTSLSISYQPTTTQHNVLNTLHLIHCGPNILSSLFSPIHLQSQPSAHLCHLITFHNSSQSPACILLCTHPFHKIAHHP